MTTIGVVYAISHSAGEICSGLIKEKTSAAGLEDVKIIYHEQNSELYKAAGSDIYKIALLLKQSVDHLVNNGAEIIVIAANSVHRGFDDLKKMIQNEPYANKIKLLNIMDETTTICAKDNLKKICLLGSSNTLKSRLYQDKLESIGIQNFPLSEEQQLFINQLIEKEIAPNNITLDEQKKIKSLVSDLKSAGVEGLVLACTGLGTIFNPKNIDMKIIDSNICLADAAVRSAQNTFKVSQQNITAEQSQESNFMLSFRKST